MKIPQYLEKTISKYENAGGLSMEYLKKSNYSAQDKTLAVLSVKM